LGLVKLVRVNGLQKLTRPTLCSTVCTVSWHVHIYKHIRNCHRSDWECQSRFTHSPTISSTPYIPLNVVLTPLTVRVSCLFQGSVAMCRQIHTIAPAHAHIHTHSSLRWPIMQHSAATHTSTWRFRHHIYRMYLDGSHSVDLHNRILLVLSHTPTGESVCVCVWHASNTPCLDNAPL